MIAIDEEETSFQSTATVTINIKDTNDKSPMFLKDIYKFVVAEHSPVGTEVGNVTVSPLRSGFFLRDLSLNVRNS